MISIEQEQRPRRNRRTVSTLIRLPVAVFLLAKSHPSEAAAAASTPSLVKNRSPLRPWGVGGNQQRNPSSNAENIHDIDVHIVKEEIKSTPRTSSSSVTDRPSDPPRRIIVMGGPASGKGTQCEWITKKYGVVHLSTGDMLRAAVSRDSSPGTLGALAKSYMDRGQLVPDKVMIGIVRDRINRPDCAQRGYLLDGFPRTRGQARALLDMGIKPDTFLYLDVSDNTLVDRVVGRRMDPVTGKIYHLKFSPPPQRADVLDRLVTRSDDTTAKAWSRLKHFHQNVNAVKKCFEDVMVVVDGNGSPSQVADSIKDVLEGRKKCVA